MNKRVVFGVGATMATALLSVSGAAFADGLDYAMSVGQVDMADTANYVIEATSDGGYVAGGQTVQCFKRPYGQVFKLSALAGGYGGWINKGIPDDAEPAMMAECEEYFADHGGEADLKSYNGKVDTPTNVMTAAKNKVVVSGGDSTLLHQYCGDFHLNGGTPSEVSASFFGTLPSARLMDYDEDTEYNYYCVDYIAKFKQDGTKEWLTTIRNGDMPVAVGETTNDYRLITTYGMLYTFARANGAEDDKIATEAENIQDAIINNDGSTVAVQWDMIGLLGSDGTVSKVLEDDLGGSTEVEIRAEGSPASRALVRTDDGFVATRSTWEQVTDDDGNEDWKETLEIIKISTDLETIETIVTLDDEDLSMLRGLWVVSADQDGNVGLVTTIVNEDNSSFETVMVTVDSEGNAIAAKPLEEVISPDYDDQMPLILDNFTVADPTTGKFTRLNADLTEIDSYPLADGEMVYDAVVLKDNSMAAVGSSSASTDNYTVDGNVNGTYLRLTAAKAPNNATNPQTGDEVNVFAISSVFATLVAAGLAMVIAKRR